MKKDNYYKKIKKYINKKYKSLKIKSKSIKKKGQKLYKNKFYLISFITVLFIFILAFVGFFIGRSSTSMDRTLDNFSYAVKSSDVSSLRKIVRDNNKKIKKESLKPLINYYDENSLKIDATINKLKNSGESDDFKLVKKDYLFFSKYYLEIKKYKITINSNFQEGMFYLSSKDDKIDSENINKIKSGESIKDVYPGVYTIKGNLPSDYSTIESSKDILIMSDKIDSLDFNAVNLNVESDFKDAEIYINDQDTLIKVSDNEKVGPILADGSNLVHIETDSPFGILKSEEKEITNVPTIKLNAVIESNEIYDDIEEKVKDFYKSVFRALNNENKDEIKESTDLVKQKIFNILSEKYFILKNKYDITNINIDKEKSLLYYEENEYKGTIVVIIDYDVSKKIFNINKTKNTKNFFTRIIYKDDSWIIEDIDNFEL
ncbi:TcaA 3rd/4th domain-containing protein [Clostridium sp. HCP1S3_B4]|uniref:TcaA 3rd/4th domain-containing protein n=2 Tax=Clostridium TaxID=1485 RepID=UPI003F8A3912